MHRNFQGYTTEATDALIGIGASSIGKFADGYVQNAVAMPHYKDAILSGHFAAQKFCPLSNEDKLRGEIIERLMCDFTVDIADMCLSHGYPENYLDHELNELQKFAEDKFISITKERTLHINPLTRQLVRVVCSVFDAYMAKQSEQQADTPRHAKAI